MKLQIKCVLDNGTLDSEKVLISVLQDANLQYFIVTDTTYSDDIYISNKSRHTHWFLPKFVKAGDVVELYTKSGENSETDFGCGNKIHSIYWGLANSVWNNDGDAAVLFSINCWETTSVNEVK